MAISIDDWKRSFHACSSNDNLVREKYKLALYRSSTTSPSRPSIRARENYNDEFQKTGSIRSTRHRSWRLDMK
jgi:hypothetical protein